MTEPIQRLITCEEDGSLPALVQDHLDTRFPAYWQPDTAYVAAEIATLPTGTLGKANVAFTSGPVWDATEEANWTVTSGGSGGPGTEGPPGPPGPSVPIEGVVPAEEDLPSDLTEAEAGQGWMTEDGTLWVWSGTGWVNAGTIQGPQGPQGPDGPPGPPGPASEVEGPQGPAGPDGERGPQGIPGVKGPEGLIWRGDWLQEHDYAVDDAVFKDGNSYICVYAHTSLPTFSPANGWELLSQKGDTGLPSDVAGPAGPQGEIGATGEQGIQGVQGIQGEQGQQGPKGDPGATGEKGDTGDTGQQGPTGPQGAQGIQGPVGAQGAPSHVAGPPGAKGDKGDKGDTGNTGAQGPTGEVGPVSEVPGPQGDAGEPGPEGPIGPQGPTGPQGDPASNLVTSVAGRQGDVVLTKADVGLPSAEDTSDADKPISTATANALAVKVGALPAGVPGTLQLWTGAQSAYDAIPTKDPGTVYITYPDATAELRPS